MEHFTPDRTAAGRRYDRTLGKLLPSSRLLSVLFCLLPNSLVYWCTQSMVAGRQLLDLTTSTPAGSLSMWHAFYFGQLAMC